MGDEIMYPFSKGDTYSLFANYTDTIIKEIQNLDNQYVLNASQTELENYYLEKAKVHPLVLHTEEYCIENQRGVPVDVGRDFLRAVRNRSGEPVTISGTCLDIAIPYEGDSGLWYIRPSSYNLSGYPEIEIKDERIILSISFPDDSVEPTKLKSEIDHMIQSLVNTIQILQQDIDNYNTSMPQKIRSAVQRKYQLAQAASGAVSALGIPIKLRDKPLTYSVPAIRRESPIKRPQTSTEAYNPEPVLDEAQYKHILEVLRSMSLVIERNPHSFATLDEETIRDHFLLQLNGHYEGGATGETFNASGKTDILIRVDNKNVFIAECKFWHGQKAFNEAIDQVLSYLSWRDTKCALLIFNKTKDTVSVRGKMHEVMETRPEHRRTVSSNPEGDSRYIFVKKEESGREIIITTQVYDIPIREE
jgi:hypothetical protein